MAESGLYWCDKGLVVSVDGPGGPSFATIRKPFARIGSHEGSEIVLSGQDVPRRCVYLHGTDEGIFWVGLRATDADGYVMGGWLAVGQPLNVGPYRITARLATANNASVPPSDNWLAKGSAEPPFPVVMISAQGRSLGQRMLTRRLTVVGRRKPATMGLSSLSVSVCHCILYYADSQLWVVDLLAKNGVALGQRRVEAARVPVGSSLKLGVFELTYLSQSDSVETQQAMDKVQHIPSSSGVDLGKADSAELAELQRQREMEWHRRWSQLEAEHASLMEQKDEFSRQRKAWEAERSRLQIELSQETARLQERIRQFETEREVFRAQQQFWERERERMERELAERRAQLDEEAKRLKAEEEQLRKLQGQGPGA
ncbi:MAG TPA: FHA domain-containing protein [Planctomycetaceae bacterium]|nr:FHA domain-containing protein [Planctomycetaceae bacterium]HIQ23055.1 FHA domain-containing protein [Planctomycetota bacterium]